MKKDFFEALQEDIMNADITETEKSKFLRDMAQLKSKKINIMITGATGCGKSSTINALFDTEVAKIGVGVNPETMEIEKYELDNMILWDTPGLGDGKEADARHTQAIIDKLTEADADGNALIDLVLVILDGGSRDLGTSYDLINKVIIPNLGEEKDRRILVAVNQADMAMKGRNWNFDENKPEQPLVEFLEEKAASIKRRIAEASGIEVDPIYYSAGYKEEGFCQSRPYNLSKLLFCIVKAIPAEKRILIANNINEDPDNFADDDKQADYKGETKKLLIESVLEEAERGADFVEKAFEIVFGHHAKFPGRIIGAVGGAVIGFIKGIFN